MTTDLWSKKLFINFDHNLYYAVLQLQTCTHRQKKDGLQAVKIHCQWPGCLRGLHVLNAITDDYQQLTYDPQKAT